MSFACHFKRQQRLTNCTWKSGKQIHRRQLIPLNDEDEDEYRQIFDDSDDEMRPSVAQWRPASCPEASHCTLRLPSGAPSDPYGAGRSFPNGSHGCYASAKDIPIEPGNPCWSNNFYATLSTAPSEAMHDAPGEAINDAPSVADMKHLNYLMLKQQMMANGFSREAVNAAPGKPTLLHMWSLFKAHGTLT